MYFKIYRYRRFFADLAWNSQFTSYISKIVNELHFCAFVGVSRFYIQNVSNRKSMWAKCSRMREIEKPHTFGYLDLWPQKWFIYTHIYIYIYKHKLRGSNDAKRPQCILNLRKCSFSREKNKLRQPHVRLVQNPYTQTIIEERKTMATKVYKDQVTRRMGVE